MYRIKQYGFIPPPYGGVSVFIKRLALSLAKKGWGTGAFHSGCVIGWPKELSDRLDRFPYHTRSILVLPEVLKLLNIFRHYDLIHSHLSLNSCFSTWIVHKLLQMPVVYTIHNQMLDSEIRALNIIDRYCFKSLAEDDCVQFTAVGPETEREFNSYGFYFRRPIMVLPAYIPPVEVGEISDYLPFQLECFIKSNLPFILFYAESLAKYNNTEIYGLQTIVDIFPFLKKSIPELRMVICVTNLEDIDDLQPYERELKEYSESIYWQVGPLAEMWPLMKAATVLLRPTCTDGDAIMIREALSYGLPVVTSDVVNRPEGCVLYEYGNDQDLINKTLSVLQNPKRTVFAQSDYSSVMMQIYEELLSLNNDK